MAEASVRSQRQTAYQVLVASTEDRLKLDQGDLWDSGKVVSSESLQIEYSGQPLLSKMRCHWQVRVWGKDGNPTAWSRPATWEMGLLAPQDWQALWLNDGKAKPVKTEDFYLDDPAPLFCKEFNLPKQVARARLHISGLGYYQASLNGGVTGSAGSAGNVGVEKSIDLINWAPIQTSAVPSGAFSINITTMGAEPQVFFRLIGQ